MIENHAAAAAGVLDAVAAGKRDRILAVAAAFAKRKLTQDDVAVVGVVAVGDLGGVAVDRHRAGRRLAGDVVIGKVFDVERAACELNRAGHVEDDDFIRRVLHECAAQRAGAAVVEIRNVIDRGVGEPAGGRRGA